MELENKIYLGDSLELMKQIPDKSIDLIYTDPPYLHNKHSSDSTKGFFTKKILKTNTELNNFELSSLDNCDWCKEAVRIMKTINIYIWCSRYQIPMYFDYFLKELDCSFNILAWLKTNPVPSYSNGYSNDKEICLYFRKNGYCKPKDMFSSKTYFLQPINLEDKEKYGHPTIKPLNIVKQMIENSTTEGQLVFDPFLGSGTTAVASWQLKRKYLGIEKNEEFFNIAQKRIEEEKKILELF